MQKYIEGLVGGSFNTVITQVTLTAASKQILPNNFERMAAAIINTGSTNISVGLDQSVTTTLGILLGANGGNISVNASQDIVLPGWSWWAIPFSGTPTVTVIEVIRISNPNDKPGAA